jgi:hypothetical protein
MHLLLATVVKTRNASSEWGKQSDLQEYIFAHLLLATVVTTADTSSQWAKQSDPQEYIFAHFSSPQGSKQRTRYRIGNIELYLLSLKEITVRKRQCPEM